MFLIRCMLVWIFPTATSCSRLPTCLIIPAGWKLRGAAWRKSRLILSVGECWCRHGHRRWMPALSCAQDRTTKPCSSLTSMNSPAISGDSTERVTIPTICMTATISAPLNGRTLTRDAFLYCGIREGIMEKFYIKVLCAAPSAMAMKLILICRFTAVALPIRITPI